MAGAAVLGGGNDRSSHGLVSGRLLHVIDDEHFDRAFGRFRAQPELLDRAEDGRARDVGGERFGRRNQPALLAKSVASSRRNSRSISNARENPV